MKKVKSHIKIVSVDVGQRSRSWQSVSSFSGRCLENVWTSQAINQNVHLHTKANEDK